MRTFRHTGDTVFRDIMFVLLKIHVSVRLSPALLALHFQELHECLVITVAMEWGNLRICRQLFPSAVMCERDARGMFVCVGATNG